MIRLKEFETVLQFLGVPLLDGKVRPVELKLEGLKGGYTKKERWKRDKRRFGEILKMADNGCGDEGVEYCLVHYFLDALHRDSAGAYIKKVELHLPRRFVCQTPSEDARLELLLMVQEDFPVYMRVVEELASALRDKEKEITDFQSHHDKPVALSS